MKRLIVAAVAIGALICTANAAAAQTIGWKGCDGKPHLIQKVNGSLAICMKNGRILGCSEAVTRAHCQQIGAH